MDVLIAALVIILIAWGMMWKAKGIYRKAVELRELDSYKLSAVHLLRLLDEIDDADHEWPGTSEEFRVHVSKIVDRRHATLFTVEQSIDRLMPDRAYIKRHPPRRGGGILL